ncbi:MAG: hypothetical protein PHE55_10175 [Methylococcaceae bacterium]|nr:hypothetical protein [Methylococcaceae bacterium]
MNYQYDQTNITNIMMPPFPRRILEPKELAVSKKSSMSENNIRLPIIGQEPDSIAFLLFYASP